MSIPYINFSTENHTGVILGAQQSIQRQLNINPNWTEIRCVGMARLVGGNRVDNGIGDLQTEGVNELVENLAISKDRFYFGLKDNSENLPESLGSKFIGMGVNSNVRKISTSPDNSGQLNNYGVSAAGVYGINNTNSLYANAINYGVSVGENNSSEFKFISTSTSSSTPNNRFQPLISTGTVPETNFCSPVGFSIKVSDRGTEAQKIKIFNYGSATPLSTIKTFSDLSESFLDDELSIIGINQDDPLLYSIVDAPHSQWDLSGIDSFYLYWPFNNNRLILFNLKVKVIS